MEYSLLFLSVLYLILIIILNIRVELLIKKDKEIRREIEEIKKQNAELFKENTYLCWVGLNMAKDNSLKREDYMNVKLIDETLKNPRFKKIWSQLPDSK